MSFRRRLAVILASTSAAAAAVLGAAVPAHADGITAISKNNCASTTFKSHGDHFWLFDNCADGHGAAVQYVVDGRTHTRFNHNGFDGRNPSDRVLDVNENLPEGKRLTYRACLSNGTTVLTNTCGGWEVATA